MDQGQSVLGCNIILWLVHLCIWYSNNIIAPCYQESVANEVISTVGGVRFIKWAQDLVSFVKCEPPSILLCGGNKRYSAFKDILAPISFFRHHQPGMAPQAEGYVGGPNQPLKSLTLKGKSFLHNKRQTSWWEIASHPSCEVFAYLVLRGKMRLNPQFANRSSSRMGAIGPGITSIEEVLEFPIKRMSKGSKIHSRSTREEGLTLSWSSHLQRLIVCWFGQHCF